MSTHLTRGKLNIGLIQEKACNEFLSLLDKCPGSKALICDGGLFGPLDLITEFSLLKKRQEVKIHRLGHGKVNIADEENIIFITRPYLKLMKYISENIHGNRNSFKKRKLHLFFIPLKSLTCEEYLKTKDVHKMFTSIEQISSWLIFPFDNDLMSMELDSAFKDYYLDSDPTCIYQIAKVVEMLQNLYGPIKRVSGKGNVAYQVMKLLTKFEEDRDRTIKSDQFFKITSQVQIDQLILIDRNVDLISPLMTQLTFEGLIDELYGINNCTVKLPAEKFVSQDEKIGEQNKILALNSADEVYSEIRDQNFFAIGQLLSRRAKLISSQFDERLNGRTLQEMKQFVAKLPQMLAIKKSLANHMTIAELIKKVTDSENFIENIKNERETILSMVADKINPYIEDCMTDKVDLTKVLRLICLQSIVNGGLKSKVLEQYKRDIVHTYGFQHILTLTNLEKVGLLKAQQGARPFSVFRKTLKLTVEESNSFTPKDIHYVYGMYAPLSVRLIQQFTKLNGIKNITDVLSLQPGPLFDQSMNQKILSTFSDDRREGVSSPNNSANVVLVFFIGGCTFAEISALRFLSQQEDLNVEFVIATTKIINGNSFIKALMEPLS